jgi:hypothetical protein
VFQYAIRRGSWSQATPLADIFPLTTGMIKESDGLDSNCPGDKGEVEPRVAAIVNWYGISDVNDVITGKNVKNYAVEWLGSSPYKEEIARRASPLTYVRKGNPPIITIHGEADDIDDPLCCVVLGAGKILSDFKLLEKISIE